MPTNSVQEGDSGDNVPFRLSHTVVNIARQSQWHTFAHLPAHLWRPIESSAKSTCVSFYFNPHGAIYVIWVFYLSLHLILHSGHKSNTFYQN